MEKSLKFGDEVSGHYTNHIDTVGKVLNVKFRVRLGL